MSLQVQPLELKDFDTIISHASDDPPGDDLVGNPVPVCWPVTSREQAEARCRWHFERQKKRFTDDPSVRWIKVVETEHPERIISIARWHYYEHGYSYERDARWEPAGEQAATDRDMGVFDWAVHDKILSTRDSGRAEWITPNESPCWILMHMNTRPSQQRRGAAKLLVKWGIEQADKTGVPAYLEAGVMGFKLYKDLGFTVVGEPVFIDAANGFQFKVARMMYRPVQGGA